MPHTYRVGVLGLGHWYSAFALGRALRDYPRAQLVAVAYPDAAKAKEYAAMFGIDAYTDYHAVIARDDVDIVHISAPCADIPACCIEAARAGKHIVLGKPIAMTVEDADQMVAAVQRADIRCVTHQGMHRARMAEWKRSLDNGLIGDIKLINVIIRQGIAEDWFRSGTPGWFADPQRTPGGAFIDEAIYEVDRMLWLANSRVAFVEMKIANLIHKDIAVEDWGRAEFTFANGIQACIESGWTITQPRLSGPSPKHNAITYRDIVGTRGEIINNRLLVPGDAMLGPQSPHWTFTRAASELYTAPQPDTLSYLIECIEERKDSLASIAAARDALAVTLAAYESARTGQPVRMPCLP